jgi:hypothetical protein
MDCLLFWCILLPMPYAPGKYADEVTALRERYHAHSVVIIVLGGDKGSDFSMQGSFEDTLELPELLEHIAAHIREEQTRTRH